VTAAPVGRRPADPADEAVVLECRGLRKRYAEEGFELGPSDAGLSLSVGRGEMFALLGPSGCGKTTTLRIIGGFTPPDEGRVLVDGVDITRRPPYARPTNTVFQSYALFPHLSVGSNVAFGLTMERVDRRTRRQRVTEALELVGLSGFERRRVSELSGGQQQRAALARALVKRPSVLLLDEPLGALDLKLRKQMQDELVRLKRSMSATFVHVTHDQEEACAVADRIAVMRDGDIVQVGEPLALYQRPATTFVASFLDAGTVIRGKTSESSRVVTIATPEVTVRAPSHGFPNDTPVAAVIPVDKIELSYSGNTDISGARGRVVRVVFTGAAFLIYVDVAGGREFKVSASVEKVETFDPPLEPGREVALTWRPDDVILTKDDDAPVETADAAG
jgi:ABC-type Fe3+/spermidine/putrescine transport system ATPase subunit